MNLPHPTIVKRVLDWQMYRANKKQYTLVPLYCEGRVVAVDVCCKDNGYVRSFVWKNWRNNEQ